MTQYVEWDVKLYLLTYSVRETSKREGWLFGLWCLGTVRKMLNERQYIERWTVVERKMYCTVHSRFVSL